MALNADRRSVLSGMAALGLVGCDRAPVSDVRVTPFDTMLDLTALEARHGGRIGLSAFNDDGRVTWRGGERFVYCSTFKMFLAAATLLRIQAGQERLDRAIAITAADMISHAPVTQPAVGGTLTIAQLMQGTVEVSDNPAANILIREMGGLETFRAFYRGIGDTVTRVDRLEPEMNRLDGDKDTITPIQSANNISHLLVSPNTPLDTASKALLTRWMTDSPTGLGRIKAGVPAGWGVAHKTGTGGYGPVNDIGVIYPPSGGPVVIAIYFHAERTTRTAEAEAVIAEATRLALSGLGIT
jgi:beta-lactamase class A